MLTDLAISRKHLLAVSHGNTVRITDLGTTNGNLEVTLPSDLHATFEANTTNGRVTISGFQIKTRGTLTSKSILGVIGGGGARVALRTTNGNIDATPTGTRRKR